MTVKKETRKRGGSVHSAKHNRQNLPAESACWIWGLNRCGKQRKRRKIMKEFTYTITDPVGIHARPAGLLTKEVKKYASTFTLTKGDKSADMSKLMKLMSLGVVQGDTVTIKVEGPDEETAAAAIEQFMKDNF